MSNQEKQHTCEHSGVTFPVKDSDYQSGYLDGFNAGFNSVINHIRKLIKKEEIISKGKQHVD